MKRAPGLKAVCILGLTISLILLGAVLFFTHYTGWNDLSEQGNFFRELRNFDALTRELKPRQLNSRLDRLEKKAIGVESHLSVLKRRRNLVRQASYGLQASGPNRAVFQSAYRKAAERALAAFPFSGPLAAIAADALLQEYPGQLSAGAQTMLRQYAGLFSDPRLIPLALDAGVLLGDLSDPATAAALPLGGELLAAGVSTLSGAEREDFLINAVIHRLLTGDRVLANSRIVSLLQAPTEKALRFGAEYFYDARNPLRAAELFSQFSDAPSLGRLADSLWLAGFREGAIEIWTALVSPGDTPRDLRVRSLYNLASAIPDEQKKLAYYGELFSLEPGHVYGLIGCSRLFDAARAEAVLAEQGAGKPLPELELLRRRRERGELQRTVAETWLLLNRYPQAEELYRWGAWYFDRQRQYPETALLLRQARLNGIDDAALVLHEAFRLIREGRLDEAEALLKEASLSPRAHTGIWQVPANLGLIAESRRALSRALEYYESAASLVKDRPGAARVQLRIARCLHILGRDEDSRRALETVLELEPENLNARMELRRLSL
jgi:tetratricopeptide (TPR) repeat protein